MTSCSDFIVYVLQVLLVLFLVKPFVGVIPRLFSMNVISDGLVLGVMLSCVLYQVLNQLIPFYLFGVIVTLFVEFFYSNKHTCLDLVLKNEKMIYK